MVKREKKWRVGLIQLSLPKIRPNHAPYEDYGSGLFKCLDV
jgi:hypothetical protein